MHKLFWTLYYVSIYKKQGNKNSGRVGALGQPQLLCVREQDECVR